MRTIRLEVQILLALLAALTITITVHDPSGRAVANADVRILSLNGVLKGKTVADGSAQFEVPEGTYTVEVSSPGFWRYSGDRRVNIDTQEIDVVLRLPMTCGFPSLVDYSPRPDGTSGISGMVVDADGYRGLRAAHIEIIDLESKTKSQASSDRSGHFVLTTLPEGHYALEASKEGYVPAEINRFIVSRKNVTLLKVLLDKRGHIHVCQ